MMSNVISFADMHSPDGEARNRQEIVRSLYEMIQGTSRGMQFLPDSIKEAIDERVWERDRIYSGGTKQGAMSFEEFVTRPYPAGLGTTLDVIRAQLATCSDVKSATEARNLIDALVQRPVGNPTGANQHTGGIVDNVNNSGRPAGNTVDAGLRRLRKEAEDKIDPETGEVLVAGNAAAKEALSDVIAEKISVHKALVDLGIRKPTLTIRDEPEAVMKVAIKKSGAYGAAMRAWRDMTGDERVKFLDWASENVKS